MPITKEELLRQHAEGNIPEFNGGLRAANYIVVNTEGNANLKSYTTLHGACHTETRRRVGPRTIAVITFADPETADHEGLIKFYNWFMNETCFSKCFLVKDAALSLKNGFVVDPSACTGQEFLAAVQVCRLTTSEHKLQMRALGEIIRNDISTLPMGVLMMLILGLKVSVDEHDTLVADAGILDPQRAGTGYFQLSGSDHLPFPREINCDEQIKILTTNKQRGASTQNDPFTLNSTWPPGSATFWIGSKNREGNFLGGRTNWRQVFQDCVNSLPTNLNEVKIETKEKKPYDDPFIESTKKMLEKIWIRRGTASRTTFSLSVWEEAIEKILEGTEAQQPQVEARGRAVEAGAGRLPIAPQFGAVADEWAN
jgi:hypothetical protein